MAHSMRRSCRRVASTHRHRAANGWVDYVGSFNYAGASGTSSLGFESISTGAGSNTVATSSTTSRSSCGRSWKFVQPSSSTPESASNNRPTLRVNGTVFAAFDVTVLITAAAPRSAATTPRRATPPRLTITVPAGVYDGVSAGSLFALPVTVSHDLLSESNETIVF